MNFKDILTKTGIDVGAFLMIAPVSTEVMWQVLIALAVLVINTILFPLVKVLTEWIKWKLKKHLPNELHHHVDEIGKHIKNKTDKVE